DYKPMAGEWSSVVDGFLFLKTVNPPHPAAAVAATEPVTPATPAPRTLGRLNPATHPSAQPGAALTLSGTVLDRNTGQPVPFATVAVPARSAGTVTDAQGRFRLEARRNELMQISSIGYEPATLPAQPAGALSIRLTPAAFALANVRVSAQSQDPKRIMQKVIKAAETNYEQQDYMAQVYTHRRLSNFDTLRHEVEYVSQVFEPAGHRDWGGGFLALGPTQTHAVRETHVVVPSAKPLGQWDYSEGGHGFYTEGSDPVRISPLFKSGTLGKFKLQLDTIEQRGAETLYVIQFAAKRASKRATGFGLTAGYSGKVYVRQQDYAVVRYEALWLEDTVKLNAVARRYQGRKNLTARIFSRVFSDHRKAHVVTYQKAENGRYHVAASLAQTVVVGHVLDGKPFYNQKSCEEYFISSPAEALATHPDEEKEPDLKQGEIWQLNRIPYRPAFWQTYQRPVPAEPAPTLNATKP
ncbi:MAG: carboxypeptidase-like regulatory domain-containing protein, partial [Hymenobacter sp.]|nr:carboxypeptidase-like regulatory domain-containing protein [Hymenobacter sp.]